MIDIPLGISSIHKKDTMLYIIDSKNKTKFEGLMNALGKSLEQNINTQRIFIEGMPDVHPVTRADTIHAATEGVNTLVRAFLTNDERSPKPAIAICLQKGIDLDGSLLTCVIAIRKTDTQKVYTTCADIPVSPEIKQLVQEKGMALYEAYRIVYGDDVADKKISLFETVSPGSLEVEWFAKGIEQALKSFA